MTTVRETKRADELKPGDWLAPAEGADDDHSHPAEIVATLPFETPNLGQRIKLVFRDPDVGLGTWDVNPTTALGVATEQEIAEWREATERAEFTAGLRKFADWVDANPWAPVKRDGGYPQQARLQVDLHGADMDATAAAVGRIREYASRLGVKVDESSADRTDASAVIGSVSYSVIAWHKGGRPAEPKPLVDPDASMEAHYDAETERQAPHPSWPTEASLKPWESLAPTAVRIAESMEGTDPTGLTYTRADDEPACLGRDMDCGRPLPCPDHPTAGPAAERAREILAVAPVSPARVALHAGAMVGDGDGRLVDATAEFDPAADCQAPGAGGQCIAAGPCVSDCRSGA